MRVNDNIVSSPRSSSTDVQFNMKINFHSPARTRGRGNAHASNRNKLIFFQLHSIIRKTFSIGFSVVERGSLERDYVLRVNSSLDNDFFDRRSFELSAGNFSVKTGRFVRGERWDDYLHLSQNEAGWLILLISCAGTTCHALEDFLIIYLPDVRKK